MKTRFEGLCIDHIKNAYNVTTKKYESLYRFEVDGKCTGLIYHTKEEILSDIDRFANEYGF